MEGFFVYTGFVIASREVGIFQLPLAGKFREKISVTIFDIFTAVKMQVRIFCIVTFCGRIPTFRSTLLLPPSGQRSTASLHGLTTQKTSF